MWTIIDLPLPPLGPTLPEVISAIARIRVELAAVRREQPSLTEREALREARRHSAGAMIDAINADDGHRARTMRLRMRRLRFDIYGPTQIRAPKGASRDPVPAERTSQHPISAKVSAR